MDDTAHLRRARDDGAGETVLGAERGGTRVTRRVFRYLPFTIGQDALAEPTYEAECVSGEAVECEAESGPYGDPEPVEEWMRKHTQGTGHLRYLRIFSDYAALRPSPGEAGDACACAPCVAELDQVVRVHAHGRDGRGDATPTGNGPCEHRRIEQRGGKAHCRSCERQIYL